MTQHIELDLSPDLLQHVQEAVAAGEYASTSEMVDRALREWSEQRALEFAGIDYIQRAWDEVDLDGPPGDAPEIVFARLMKEFGESANESHEARVCPES